MLPYEICHEIFKYAKHDRITVLNFMSTNKYYSSVDYVFVISDYLDKYDKFTFRQIRPNRLNLLNMTTIDNDAIKNIIKYNHHKTVPVAINPTLLLSQDSIINFTQLHIHQINNLKKMVINRKFSISNLVIHRFSKTDITINCNQIETLELFECTQCNFRVINPEQSINRIECIDNKKCSITGISDNPKLFVSYDIDDTGKLGTSFEKIIGTVYHPKYNKNLIKKSKNHYFAHIQESILCKLMANGYNVQTDVISCDIYKTNDQIKNLLDVSFAGGYEFFTNENIHVENRDLFILCFFSATRNLANQTIHLNNCNICELRIYLSCKEAECILDNCTLNTFSTICIRSNSKIILNNCIIDRYSTTRQLHNDELIILTNTQISFFEYRKKSNIILNNSIIEVTILDLDKEYQTCAELNYILPLSNINSIYRITGKEISETKLTLLCYEDNVLIIETDYCINFVGLAKKICINNNVNSIITVEVSDISIPILLECSNLYTSKKENDYICYELLI